MHCHPDSPRRFSEGDIVEFNDTVFRVAAIKFHMTLEEVDSADQDSRVRAFIEGNESNPVFARDNVRRLLPE
ncbi:hypothetical protein LAV_00125 [Sphingobium phage Lacusarx]|uniref:Uncharacterized protein n=1 Tax=Sphingobium phage Lacusarx TaxID=1980139 RepID=A0A1W6DWW1_9CAUD|nr:hypothetical protein FDH44_gp178 [Sphingobium phage Lacusarx]ARK07500.1 hypothetical protein LAV_00125 [Sphingobium phage Lacusarx]